MPDSVRHSFASTRWSLIAQATDPDELVSRPAVEELLRCYYLPMKTYLVQRGMRPEDADDCLQDFVLGKFLAGFLNREWDREQQFRAFLKRCLKNFMISRLRSENRQANRPNAGPTLEVDHLQDLAADHKRAADALDRDWARTVLELSLTRMHNDLLESDRLERWTIFVERFLRPTLCGTPAVSYEVLQRQTGMESQRQAENILINEKRRFGRVLTGVIGEYAGAVDDADQELRELQQIVSAATGLQVRIPGEADHVSVCTSVGEVLEGGFSDVRDARRGSPADELAALLDTPLNALRGQPALPSDCAWASCTASELVSQDSPEIEALDRLRRYTKAVVRTQPDKPSAAHLLLYHACLAAARLRTSGQISKLSDEQIHAAASRHLESDWFGEPIRSLMQQAASRLG